ncbi:helix-turn-helix transcriptional regulator [Parerythrobacter aestuarii]|uniref:helix-turn-helix transcriptional regulator n=1 Tax=Parerythrobacter aestuarii TaxID=3020909 RepID=UPI0024DE88F2|nr:helix-turn-helix transcriptional regulator [Parerythrobacter aestuarii]
MAVTLLEAQDLVALLHRGTLGSNLWRDFLLALQRRTGADEVVLFLAESGATGGGVVQLGPMQEGSPTMADPDLAELATRGSPLRPKRVYAARELGDLLDVRQGQALARLGATYGLAHLRTVRVGEPGGAGLWLVIGRRGEDFGAADVALLGMLADHLEIALRTWSALEQERLRAGITGDAIKRLNFGWFLLDSGGTIIDHSAEAEALLHERRALLRSPAGKLVPELREAQGAMRRYLDQLSKGHPGSKAIHLSDEPWLDMLLTPRRGGRPGAAPMVTAYVHGEGPTGSERNAQLQDLFGLTAKEAQLALLISRGVKIAEAAGQLGLTVQSARLYSKRVYAKTGTRGQADLVRLVLASIVALS